MDGQILDQVSPVLLDKVDQSTAAELLGWELLLLDVTDGVVLKMSPRSTAVLWAADAYLRAQIIFSWITLNLNFSDVVVALLLAAVVVPHPAAAAAEHLCIDFVCCPRLLTNPDLSNSRSLSHLYHHYG